MAYIPDTLLDSVVGRAATLAVNPIAAEAWLRAWLLEEGAFLLGASGVSINAPCTTSPVLVAWAFARFEAALANGELDAHG